MKNTSLEPKAFALLAGLLFGAAGLVTASASTTVMFSVDMSSNVVNGTFDPTTNSVYVQGSFNGWTSVQLQESALTGPGSLIYTNSVIDTNDTNGVMQYKFLANNPLIPYGGYESLCDGGGNRCLHLNGGTMAPPTPFFGDSGAGILYTNTVTFSVDMTEQIALKNFTNGVDTVSVIGNFNGWNVGTQPSYFNLTLNQSQAYWVTNEPSGIVTSNVYVGTFTNTALVSTNAHMAYQFIIDASGGSGKYEGLPPFPGNTNNDSGGNRWYTQLPVNQTFPTVFFHDTPFAPIASNLTFSVDMSVFQQADTNFDPTTLQLWGDFNGWAGGISCTNNPMAANTNIYTCTSKIDYSIGQTANWQFRYNWKVPLANSPSTVTIYDSAGFNTNRYSGAAHTYLVVSNTNPNGTNILVSFDDAKLDDILDRSVAVQFSVDMMTNGGWVTDYNATNGTPHTFDPNNDDVYLNGAFIGWYSWAPGSPNPTPAEPAYRMIRAGTSSIYTNTIVVPGGQSPYIVYKYGIDIGRIYGVGLDDEAGFDNNHVRVVRSTVYGTYQMPKDTFGNQYNEPFFEGVRPGDAKLTVGAVSGGAVPVTWLGRPGAHLQTKSSLSGGTWQDLWDTDGTNWTSGYSSTNGFVSVTNYPTAGGNTYFRLVNP